MRGLVAKKLRRQAYDDLSIREKKYWTVRHTVERTAKDKDGKEVKYKVNRDTVKCKGPRAVYLALKKGWGK